VGRVTGGNGSIVVVYARIGGAGGADNHCYLNVYSQTGELVSQILFAQFSADCGFEDVLTGRIDKDLMISIQRSLYQGDCLQGPLPSVSSEQWRYRILEGGRIVRN